jgi:hypothetical protein
MHNTPRTGSVLLPAVPLRAVLLRAVLLPAVLLVVLPAPAPAQPAAAPPAAAQLGPEPATVHMSYTGTALGLDVLKLDADVGMDRTGYRIDTVFHTVGLLSLFVRSEQHTTVQGTWRGEQAQPVRFWSWGTLRGDPRQTLIDYVNGAPEVRTLLPPNKGERDDVPEALRGNTIDTLSALAFLVRQVADTGKCDGSTRVFDGRRLTDIAASTVGQAVEARGEAGPYQGPTLRCNFAGRQLAGFMHSDSAWQHQPHNGTAWIARPVPGGPPIPVRLSFETRWVGDVTMVLDSAAPGPLAQAAR